MIVTGDAGPFRCEIGRPRRSQGPFEIKILNFPNGPWLSL